MFKVSYRGFLQDVVRYFPTKQRAIQWARQCGVYGLAKIEPCEDSFRGIKGQTMNRADTIKALADVLGDYLPDSRAELLEVAEKLLNLYEAGKLPHLVKG